MREDSLPTTYKAGEIRSRSMPHAKPFFIAVFFSALTYFGVVAAITSLVVFILHPQRLEVVCFVISLGFSALAWLIAFFKRRSAYCPLCKGTPLINTGAFTHAKAYRLPPLNHGTTATLSIIFTQRFRCMYCGSRYDMLKKPSYLGTTPENMEG